MVVIGGPLEHCKKKRNVNVIFEGISTKNITFFFFFSLVIAPDLCQLKLVIIPFIAPYYY